MNLIVCVDKSFGMMFNNRRVSQDKEVLAKIKELINDSKLYVSSYSSKLFDGLPNIIVDNFDRILEGDFYYIEDTEIPNKEIEKVYIFNWNRDYPADKYFEIDLSNYTKEKKEDFVGNSHKKITLEIYRRV